jgi:hypothetical protein
LVTESTSRYFTDVEQHDMNAWILGPFTVEEKVMEDKHVKAKAEFLGPQDGNTLKAEARNRIILVMI